MTRSRGVLGNAGWNAFGTLFNIIIAFLLAPLLIHRLGVDEWGLLLLVWSVAGILGLANFGLGEATLRYVAHYHADGDLRGVNRILGSSLTYYVSVCGVVIGAVWLGAPLISGWLKVPDDLQSVVAPLLRLTTLLFTAGILTNAFRAIPMALHRYDLSSALGSIQGIVRSTGLVLLVLAGYGVVTLVIWEVFVAAVGLVVYVVVARKLVPQLHLWPSMSLVGMREIIGYSVFSFMTHIFLMIYREAGKLILGNRFGTANVAYLGTPDSISYRLHMIVVSAIETLVPRFSASRNSESAKTLLLVSTWAAVVCGAVVYVPLAVLMPDFLRLWISPEFAQESGEVGRLLTLGLIGSGVFAPIATFYRGQGKPGLVTAVMAAAGTVVLVGALLLVPLLGVVGVGYAYFLANVAWIGGLCIGWQRVYGPRALMLLARIAVPPLAIACGFGLAEATVVRWWNEPGWIALVIFGAAFALTTALAVVLLDFMVGGTSAASLLLERAIGTRQVIALKGRVSFGRRAARP